VWVAIYCRPPAGCRGVATLVAAGTGARSVRGHAAAYGSTAFAIHGNKTSHVRITVDQQVIKLIRAHRQLRAALTVLSNGRTYRQVIGLRI
jgi:hypothetical protein